MTQEKQRIIDDYSFALGIIFAFTEVVAADVKQLALSEPATPEMMQALLPEAQRIANRFGIQIHVETDLIETDLFPAEQSSGKQVLLMYRGDVLKRYEAIKQAQQTLKQNSQYEGKARRDIAVKFGQLLSYSDARINALLQNK